MAGFEVITEAARRGLSRAEAEERRVKEYEEATRQPNGSYRTYSFLIRCYKPEEDVPNNLSTLRD